MLLPSVETLGYFRQSLRDEPLKDRVRKGNGMGFLIVMAVLGLSWAGIWGTWRRLRRVNASRVWWVRFGALAVVGAVAGVGLAIAADYQVSPTMRFGSFPVPLVFYQLEDGRWIDFVTPPFVLYPGVVANISSVIAAAVVPLWVGSMIVHRKVAGESVSARKEMGAK